MAVTFAVSDLSRNVAGSKRVHTGLLTCSGTTTDNGDAITPAALAMSVIENLELEPALDSASNPEAVFVTQWNKSTGKISFFSQATAGATTPLAAITDGTSVANYLIRFVATGR